MAISPIFYGWLPLSKDEFLFEMSYVGNGDGRSFLDVGSGLGEKLVFARELGFDAHGLELRPELVDIARRFFPEFPVTIDNALEYDRYGDFDVIYLYQLSPDHDIDREINERIVDQMRPGAYFVCAGGPYPDDDRLEHVGAQVWRMR